MKPNYTVEDLEREFTHRHDMAELFEDNRDGYWLCWNKLHAPDPDRHFKSLRQALRAERADGNRHAGIRVVFGVEHVSNGGVYCGCSGPSVYAAADYERLPSASMARGAFESVRRT